MKNRKRMRRALLPAFLCLLLITGSSAVHAAGEQAEVTIEVEQNFQAEYPPKELNETFTYALRPEDETVPVPEGTEDGIFQFQISGKDTEVIGPIVYNHGGVYSYTLSQVMPEDSGLYTLDSRVYQVHVCVSNTRDGGLTAVVVLENEQGQKEEGAVFENSYKGAAPASTVTPTPTPQESLGENPETGDKAVPMLWVLTAVLSGGLLTVLTIRKRKTENS